MTNTSAKLLVTDTILMSGFTTRVYYTKFIRDHAPKEDVLKFENEHGEPRTWTLETEKLFYETFINYIPMI